jgi:hypothetical protein
MLAKQLQVYIHALSTLLRTRVTGGAVASQNQSEWRLETARNLNSN